MIIEVKIPQVGESINEVSIGTWVKNDGDYVEMDEVIAEIESEKATLELTAEKEGTLSIITPADDIIEIGHVVAKIDTAASAPTGGSTPATEPISETTPSPAPVAITSSKPAPSKQGKVDITLPAAGESLTEVTIGAWLKADGEYVMMDEPIAEIESEKATLELTAEYQGQLKITVEEGETIPIETIIGSIDTDIEAPADLITETVAPATGDLAPASAPITANQASETAPKGGYPSPSAAKILREGNADASQVSGTGKDGRITKSDALAHIKNLPAGSGFDVNELIAETNAFSRETEEKKMTALRKTISKRLVASKNQTAMLTTFNEVDMKPIMDIRNKYKKKFEEAHNGTRLGFMSFFLKASAIALQEIPGVNAQLNAEQTHILYSNFADISIAVSTPKGLVVPVIKNAESLALDGLENEVRRLALKGRDGKLTMEEMTGGTFTITNGGTFGSLISTPIINQPQSAILGMHAIKERPVAINGEVVIRPMMYLALSYDHRIIDGKESVTFLVRLKELLENPEQMIFGKDPVEALLGL